MVQMTNKKVLVGVASSTSIVYVKKADILQRMSIRMLFFLSVCFVVRVMCRSGKSPVRACGFTGSIFTRMD